MLKKSLGKKNIHPSNLYQICHYKNQLQLDEVTEYDNYKNIHNDFSNKML